MRSTARRRAPALGAALVALAVVVGGVVDRRPDETGTEDVALPREHDALPVRPARVLGLATPVDLLTASGWHAAVSSGESPDAFVVTWNARSGATRRAEPFVPSTGGEELDELAIAGDRAAWVFSDWEPRSFIVSTLVVAGEPVRQANVIAGEELGNLHAAGAVLVYNAWTPDVRGDPVAALRRLTGEDEQVIRAGATAADVIAADEAGILLARADGLLELVSLEGATIGVVDPAAPLRDATVDGSTIFGITAAGIEAYDARSGRHTRVAPIKVPGPAPARLEGVEQRVAAYVVGEAVHLVDLVGGAELVIRPSAARGSVRARLAEVGLYYSYNRVGDDHGRVVFVPTGEIKGAFRR
jgi:hypothetical protein